ncbi:MAG: hypothetical protein KF730_12630 [Sphingomonas sp.]|uniref:hypothetical protein n=1 Tax=Sphingomonas sp. TaxID=28214 RepID=UPI0025EC5C8E|nr:hypothetical protein [Sphingomonas sp.]MBX3565407.1 hypothetical protein [Sphingomonas sp.]
MMLGDLLAAARDSAGGFLRWLHGSDPELAEQVAAAAAREGLAPGSYVRAAVADFARFASEEDWASLTSAMRDDVDPGTICLLAMVHWRLTAPGCAAHAGSNIG